MPPAPRPGNLTGLGLLNRIELVSMPTHDPRCVLDVLGKAEADEIYNLSGQSSVGISFEQPAETLQSIVGTRQSQYSRRHPATGPAGAVSTMPARANCVLEKPQPAERDRARPFQAAESLCGREGGRVLAGGQLSPGVWNSCQYRPPFQSRITAKAAALRDPQDHCRRVPDLAGQR